MHSLNIPRYLKRVDIYFLDDDEREEEKREINVRRVTNKSSIIGNEYKNKDDFMCMNNNFTVVVEYLESNLIMLPKLGMPYLINRHNQVLENNVFFSNILEKKSKQSVYVLTVINNQEGFLTKTQTCFLSGHIQLKIETQLTFPKQENILIQKWNKDKAINSKNVEEKLKIGPNYPIVSWRMLHNQIELGKWDHFFKHFNGMYENNTLIFLLYTLSCYLKHNTKMVEVFEKTENFLNCNWIHSLNYFSVFNNKQLGKSLFKLKYMKIFGLYFKEWELDTLDTILFTYIKNFSKVQTKKSSIMKINLEESIEKKKRVFVNIKKGLIDLIYGLELELLNGRINLGELKNRVNFYFKEMFGNISGISDDDIIMDLFEDKIEEGYDYRKKVDLLTRSNMFQHFNSEKDKRNSSKKELKDNSTTKSKQIRYSKLFFEQSPHALKIHPKLKQNISNPYGVFLNFNLSNKRKRKQPKQPKKSSKSKKSGKSKKSSKSSKSKKSGKSRKSRKWGKKRRKREKKKE